MRTFTNAAGNKIYLRKGDVNWWTGQGWGWTKIKEKHPGVTMRMIDFALNNPGGPTIDQHNGRETYTAYARMWRNGVPIEEVEFRVVVDNGFQERFGADQNVLRGSPGVMTAYCVGPFGESGCPGWVSDALGGEMKHFGF